MNTIPFFDIGQMNATVSDEIHAAARRALDSGWYILGRECEGFERNLAAQLGAGHVAGCNSGTDALRLSLLAAGVGHGHEVITVSNTAIPTVAAICSTGAVPVFVDVDTDTWLMDAKRVAEALTVRTKAVMAVHLYGNMVDMSRLNSVLCEAGRGDVAVIEDVAQAQGSALAGRQAGTIGRFGAFSFYPSKNIGALGDGGAVCCAGEADSGAVRMLRNYGQRDRYNAEMAGGINSRLDEVQAAILSAKLPHLNEWNSRKAIIMNRYREELRGLPVIFQEVTDGCRPAWHLCVIALENGTVRGGLQEHLRSRGIQTLIHYPIPCHRQPAFASAQSTDLYITEKLAGRILSLPLNPVLSDAEQSRVIASIRDFF
ncbi:MAG: DegT/DnrJ/EryC1/StrS family aminotransferase [Nitrospirae bacterium]|nr:DegT/DnrJ/EryC1/StrS family aminotransferase [Nitrospirota bacterium]